MIFQRLIWSALASALVVGSVQTGVQYWQAAPLILAAEEFEEEKVQAAPAPQASPAATKVAPAHESHHEWAPKNGMERTAWTWVANVLHSFSMAVLMFSVMGVWLYWRAIAKVALANTATTTATHATAMGTMRLAAIVAAAGFLALHLWPSLGLPAELPGMAAAPLQVRQIGWLVAAGCAVLASVSAGFLRTPWRWLLALLLLALPFIWGARHLQGEISLGDGAQANAALVQLAREFIWATTWVALSFWVSLAVVGGGIFRHWVRPSLDQMLVRVRTSVST